jgi:hypothetical protein
VTGGKFGGLVAQHPYEYHSYINMRQRCVNPNCPDFKYYGGRGIIICGRWLGFEGFKKFLTDMGPGQKAPASSVKM